MSDEWGCFPTHHSLLITHHFAGRRGWDSNPRGCYTHSFSRRAPSTARTPLRELCSLGAGLSRAASKHTGFGLLFYPVGRYGRGFFLHSPVSLTRAKIGEEGVELGPRLGGQHAWRDGNAVVE